MILHTDPFYDINHGMSLLTISISRICVPFFFWASGYLFFKGNIDKHRYGRYIQRIAKYWLVYSVIGFILVRPELNKSLIKQVLFDGFGPYWFFHGLIVSITLVYLLAMIKTRWRAGRVFFLVIPCLLYLAGLLLNTYFLVLPEGTSSVVEAYYYPTFLTGRNGLFEGTIFVMLGYLTAEKDIQLKRPMVILFFSFICYGAELIIVFLYTENIHGRELFIVFIILIPALHYMMKKREDRKRWISDKKAYIIRKLSFLIYSWQFVYICIIPFSINSLLRFVIILFLTILTGAIILSLSQLKSCQWIKKVFL